MPWRESLKVEGSGSRERDQGLRQGFGLVLQRERQVEDSPGGAGHGTHRGPGPDLASGCSRETSCSPH